MNNRLRLLLGCCFVLAMRLPLVAGDIYSSVMEEFSRYDNRLVGSSAYEACVSHLETALREAGLEPHRQTFDTLVPDTRECRLVVDGNDIGPIYALGPNGAANNTTGGDVLRGPLVWLGQGTLAEMQHKPVEGAIAVLRFDSPNMMQVFSQGALGVVFVGDGSETQWQVRNQFLELDAALPRVFVHEAVAKASGLMTWTPGRDAELQVTTVWKDVEAVNLWVEIPGEAASEADGGEAVILSATLDTFGTVPELSPSLRRAANCALLADVLGSLAKRPLKRSVVAVFFGSHYAVQDGARMFYYAVQRGRAGELEMRRDKYDEAAQEAKARLAILQKENMFDDPQPGLADVVRAMDKRAAGQVSELNFDLRVTRVALRDLERRDSLMPAESDQQAKLLLKETELSERRQLMNGLRRQLLDKDITDPESFMAMAGEVRQAVAREVRDYVNFAKHNVSHRELFAHIGEKRITGHYDFDFANARSDWTLNMSGAGAQMFYHSINRRGATIKIGDYVKHMRAVSDIVDSMDLTQSGLPDLFIEPALSLLEPERFCVPSIRSVPVRVAHAMQIFGYQMMSVAEPLSSDELPYRQANVDLEALVPGLSEFSERLANEPALSQTCPLAKPVGHSDTVIHFRGECGFRYLFAAQGGTEVVGAPENGITFVAPVGSTDAPSIAGQSYSTASRIRASGHIFMPFMYHHVQMRPLGFDEQGTLNMVPNRIGWFPVRMAHGYGGLIYAPLRPGSFGLMDVTMAGGDTDSLIDGFKIIAEDKITFYAEEDQSFKMFSMDGLLTLGSTKEKPNGLGVPLSGRPLYTFNPLRQSAQDYLLLNEFRLSVLREKSIVNDSLESLHADAGQHWAEAKEARADNDIALAVAHEAFAAGLGARVASPLREVTNDMVRAVVLLLLLILPFAFSMERLLVSSTSIYRQVLGFAGFFIGSFVILYLVHPAFSIAAAPLVIFLAFIIILLSVVVIAIVMSKFKKELRAIQGLSTSAHGVAAESSTALAAVLIGISGMRNRPLKTFLTALTIILLTFSIVVFASFTQVTGVTESYLGLGTGPNRIELRRSTGLGMPRVLFESLSALYEKGWTHFAREAIFSIPGSEDDGRLIVFRKSQRSWDVLQSMIALDPEELAFNPELAKAVPGLVAWNERQASGEASSTLPPIFLTPRMAESLQVSDGETVTIGGKAFVFGGQFDPLALEQMQFMDGAKLMPPDFDTSEQELGDPESTDSAKAMANDSVADTSRFTYCAARRIAITTLGNLRELEREQVPLHMNGVVMYAGDDVNVEATATEIAKMFTGPVMAKGSRGANKFFFSRSLQASGFSVLIVPLFLGGLIIFNSLLGSIVERRKEIFTYSAMGLAPPDVGALFLAESGVYAILGGMGGYLLSQVAAKVVALCGQLGWFVPPEMNFSSLSSVLTIFVVMGMVMVSTIYPAIRAGRSANPGVARKWRMPSPEGKLLEFVFPFTVSADDMGGILVFISEHFENHGDASLGSFAAAHVSLFKVDTFGNLGIRANISLAPFDLGVMQKFSMHSRPSEIEGIDEIVVQLHRESGSTGAWLRGNRVFIDDLREQFLFWRSLPVNTVAHYRSQSDAAIKQGGVNAADAQHGVSGEGQDEGLLS